MVVNRGVEISVSRFEELIRKEAQLQSILRFATHDTVVMSNIIWAIVGTEENKDER